MDTQKLKNNSQYYDDSYFTTTEVKLSLKEKSEYNPGLLKFGETVIENYTRTLYLYHRSTNVCEYKRKEK